ncbi:MAG: TetR/AcrR family transcriptional regulator [Mycobacterium sp.]
MSGREAKRLETRARLFDAAVAEIGRVGLAGADVSAIARSVGVVRGTFYFHFPTKEHVLAELQHAEEAAIVAKLEARSASSGTLQSALRRLTLEVLSAEERLGQNIFRDMLGLVFSSTRPADVQLDEHPLANYVIEAITQARDAGLVPKRTRPRELAIIFLTGLFALLTTRAASSGTGTELLDLYVKTIVSGVEVP